MRIGRKGREGTFWSDGNGLRGRVAVPRAEEGSSDPDRHMATGDTPRHGTPTASLCEPLRKASYSVPAADSGTGRPEAPMWGRRGTSERARRGARAALSLTRGFTSANAISGFPEAREARGGETRTPEARPPPPRIAAAAGRAPTAPGTRAPGVGGRGVRGCARPPAPIGRGEGALGEGTKAPASRARGGGGGPGDAGRRGGLTCAELAAPGGGGGPAAPSRGPACAHLWGWGGGRPEECPGGAPGPSPLRAGLGVRAGPLAHPPLSRRRRPR